MNLLPLFLNQNALPENIETEKIPCDGLYRVRKLFICVSGKKERLVQSIRLGKALLKKAIHNGIDERFI